MEILQVLHLHFVCVGTVSHLLHSLSLFDLHMTFQGPPHVT